MKGIQRLLITILVLSLTLVTPSTANPRVDGVVPLLAPDGTAYCTAFVIDQDRQYLMTADHCMAVAFQPVVDGIGVTEIFHVQELDVAVLRAPGLMPFRKELNARIPAVADEDVTFYGYGNGALTAQNGEVILPQIGVGDQYFMLYRPDAIPGMSGGPGIAKSDGLVIGMTQLSHPKYGLSLSRSFFQLVEATKEFWGPN